MRCSLCEQQKIKQAFAMGKQPLANKYPKDDYEIEREPLYDMNVNFCTYCISCQINVDIPRDLFFQDYFYLSSVNKELVEHFEDLALELKDKEFVVDIGSNDGVLLKPLRELNVRALGVDPSENVGAIANSKGLETIISFFNEDCGKKILERGGKPDCVVASSVFTHLDDPISFINNVVKILDDNGVLIIEVEYLRNILDNLEFERFYFDRPFYYSLKSISEISQRCGMELFDVKEIRPHGGSLRVYLKKKNAKHKISQVVGETLNNERKLLDLSFIHKKFHDFNQEIKKLRNTLKKYKEKGLKVVGYGAPARLATITNYGKIDQNLISSIVDDSPLKVNRFSPGKHIPIKSFESIVDFDFDIIILFAYEYFESIKIKFLPDIPEFYRPVPLQKLNEDN